VSNLQVARRSSPVPPHTPPILEVRDVTVRFGGITALNGMSFDVAAGEIHGLIGPNGAGKTTLFDVVSGLRRPQAGRVCLQGTDITNRSAVERSRMGVRRTFQRQQVFGELSVADNVLSALEWRGGGGGICADLVALPGRRRTERLRRELVTETLDTCGLTDLAASRAAHLPIGSARMLELARAIVDQPVLLLLDEPCSGLDARDVARLTVVLHDVIARSACAVLLVEHDMAFVMGIADHVVVLEAGEVLASGSPEQVRDNEQVRQAYFG
jgi:branched-chain amino acid transport system ATP-binding protein